MIRQVLSVVPHGIIESGQVVMSFDETTGLIDFSDTLVVGWLILTQTLQDQKELKLDPSAILSKTIAKGMSLSVEGVQIIVEPTTGSKTKANITYTQGSDQLSGIADLDLSGQYLSIEHVLLDGQVQGQSVALELVSQ